jgi:colanic acid/amylovoran biosynthesis glycosyltransferase
MSQSENGSQMSTSIEVDTISVRSAASSEESLKPTVAIWRMLWLEGSETFVRNQLNAFRQMNVLAIGARRLDSPLASAEDILLFGDGLIGRVQQRLFRITRRSRGLERLLTTSDVSLIHAHFGLDATLVAPTARRLKIPLAVTLHGYDVTSLPLQGGMSGVLYRRRLRKMFQDAAVVLPVSEFIRSKALLWGAPLNKTTVHYIGIPLEQPVDCVDGRTDVVFVGRLVETKGVGDLLTAVGGVPSDLRPRVVIVGDGPLRAQCEKLALDLEVQACFVGWQPPETVRGYLASAKIFMGPSKTSDTGDSEGLGMVFLEASNAGLPIVSYWHGGVSEAVIDGVTGFLAPEGDVAALRDNLLKLLLDPGLAQRMGEAGRRNVAAHFNVFAQTELLEVLFTRLVNGSPR